MEMRDLIIAYLIGTVIGLFILYLLINPEFMRITCEVVITYNGTGHASHECFSDPTWLQELLD